MDREGPDIINSMDSIALKELIIGCGDFSHERRKKEAVAEEQVTIDFAFSTVVTTQKIEKGETFSEDNIWVKRPGVGEIKAEFYKEVLGNRASKELDKDTHLSWSDLK